MSMLELIKKIFEIAIKIIKELINWIFKNFIKPVFDLIKTVGDIAFAPAQEDKGKGWSIFTPGMNAIKHVFDWTVENTVKPAGDIVKEVGEDFLEALMLQIKNEEKS